MLMIYFEKQNWVIEKFRNLWKIQIKSTFLQAQLSKKTSWSHYLLETEFILCRQDSIRFSEPSGQEIQFFVQGYFLTTLIILSTAYSENQNYKTAK